MQSVVRVNVTHSGIKDLSFFFCSLICATIPCASSFFPPLRLSPSSVCPDSLHPSLSPPFLILFFTSLPPVSLSLLLWFQQFPSSPSPPSHLCHSPLIHIHPIFHGLFDICLFIHFSTSFSLPLPHPPKSHAPSFLCPSLSFLSALITLFHALLPSVFRAPSFCCEYTGGNKMELTS